MVLMLFCISMFAGRARTLMVEIELRVTKLDAILLSSPIKFRDQAMNESTAPQHLNEA